MRILQGLQKRTKTMAPRFLDICTTTSDEEYVFLLQPDCTTNSSLGDYIARCLVHKEYKSNAKNPSTDKSIPLGEHMVAVILKGKISGLVISTKGKKAREVKYRKKG